METTIERVESIDQAIESLRKGALQVILTNYRRKYAATLEQIILERSGIVVTAVSDVSEGNPHSRDYMITKKAT